MSAAPQHLALAAGQVVMIRLPRGALLAVQHGALSLTLPAESLDGLLLPQQRMLAAGSLFQAERQGMLRLEPLRGDAACVIVSAPVAQPRRRWALAMPSLRGR